MNPVVCDIIIPVWNKLDLTRDCLASIYGNTHTPFNVILIDNASAAETKGFLEEFQSSHTNTRLIRNNNNLGWVKAVNQGMRVSASPYICIMNNDTVIRTDDWLPSLMEIAESESDIGLVNPGFEIKKKAGLDKPFIEIDFCRGYCVLIKRPVMERIGVLDEAYDIGYYDDDDYSVRAIRAGFRCVRANNVTVEHRRDTTFSAIYDDEKRRLLHEKNKKLFYSKWGKRLKILIVLTKDADMSKLSGLLFSIARRQHIVYVWSTEKIAGLDHINIREMIFPPFFKRMFFRLALFLNSMKKTSRRYNVIFSDDACLGHYMDIYAEKSRDEVLKTVDSLSKA